MPDAEFPPQPSGIPSRRRDTTSKLYLDLSRFSSNLIIERPMHQHHEMAEQNSMVLQRFAIPDKAAWRMPQCDYDAHQIICQHTGRRNPGLSLPDEWSEQGSMRAAPSCAGARCERPGMSSAPVTTPSLRYHARSCVAAIAPPSAFPRPVRAPLTVSAAVLEHGERARKQIKTRCA